MEGTLSMRGIKVLLEQPDLRVTELPGRIYVIDQVAHLNHAVVATTLAAIWASPTWRQPWGLVVVMADATYGADIRHHKMPPDDRRAVGTTLVTTKQLQRAVISAMGIGYRVASGFVLTATETMEQGVAIQRTLVTKVEASGKRF